MRSREATEEHELESSIRQVAIVISVVTHWTSRNLGGVTVAVGNEIMSSRRRTGEVVGAGRRGAGPRELFGLGQLFIFRRPNEAPCGSLRIENRPPGKSCGSNSSFAPSTTAVLCDAPTSATVKYASQ